MANQTEPKGEDSLALVLYDKSQQAKKALSRKLLYSQIPVVLDAIMQRDYKTVQK